MASSPAVQSPTAVQSSTAYTTSTTRSVLVIGVLSAVLYAATYWAQRSIYLNGLMFSGGGAILFGESRDQERLYLAVGVYGAATVGLFVLYAWLLRLCRNGALGTSWARRAVILFPVLFNLAFLLGRPLFSIDIWTYIAHGYLGTAGGSNPYGVRASDMIDSEFGRALVPFGWRPVHGYSPYGPLWTHIEIIAFRITQDVPTVLLLLKTVIVAASLGSGALIWRILGRVRPQDQMLGTMSYLWNPVAVVEFAGEGHNDALMIMFVLLGIYLAICSWRTWAIPALMLGVLTKFLPLILLPAQVVFLWRRRQSWTHFLLHTALGLALGIGVAVLLYSPFWIGTATFQGVRDQGRPSFYASALVTLLEFLKRTRDETEAARLTLLILGGTFALFAFLRTLLVRDEGSLLRACAWISLAYLLLATPTYWPWYVGFPLAMMALTPHGVFRWMIPIMTLSARAVAPIDDIAVNGFLETVFGYRHPSGAWGIEVWSTTIIAILFPLVCVLVLSAWRGATWLIRTRRAAMTELGTPRP
jgi:alpha-1,6-mannosyltransferase